MSYDTMFDHENDCDFPRCGQEYDRRKVPNALVKDGKILVFCHSHRAVLIDEGIPLRPLQDIHDEANKAKAQEQEARQREAALREDQAFIAGLRRDRRR